MKKKIMNKATEQTKITKVEEQKDLNVKQLTKDKNVLKTWYGIKLQGKSFN